jgi:hypothetical protein
MQAGGNGHIRLHCLLRMFSEDSRTWVIMTR